MDYTIPIAVMVVIIFLIGFVENRNNWNPPIKGIATPKMLKDKRASPYATRGRPVILNPKWAIPHMYEEVDEFHDFLKDVRGSIRVRKGKMSISNASGKMLTWSYKPFREGYWNDFTTSGISIPTRPNWFGQSSIIPNPKDNVVESPLTLVTNEEDILRFIGGEARIRIFSSSQPTFPTFHSTEHGDMVTDKFHHKIRGEEFTCTDGMILVIPRGWAYRVQLYPKCISVIRIPVLNPISWMSSMIRKIKYRFYDTSSAWSKPKRISSQYNGSDNYSEESGSEDGSVDE